MSVYQGTFYARVLQFTDSSDDSAIDVTGWTLRAMFRDTISSEDVLFELTTENGGFTITDATGGQIRMSISADNTLLMPVGKVHFDVLRTDGSDGDIYLFGGKIRVRQPVTRDE